MSYRDFQFPGVVRDLGLTLDNVSMIPALTPVPVRPAWLASLNHGVRLARGIGTEKGKSEFVIAPVLLELMDLLQDRSSVFSGIEFNVDPTRGLNGYCDFLISRSPVVYVLQAPVVAVAEAKNDNVLTGLGQCIAGMRAAWVFNAAEGIPVNQVFGVTTTGFEWKFLRLRDTALTIDLDDYLITDPGRILAALVHMVETA